MLENGITGKTVAENATRLSHATAISDRSMRFGGERPSGKSSRPSKDRTLYRAEGKSLCEIGRLLGRSDATIGRELKRNARQNRRVATLHILPTTLIRLHTKRIPDVSFLEESLDSCRHFFNERIKPITFFQVQLIFDQAPPNISFECAPNQFVRIQFRECGGRK